jgi:predicted RNase H-like HicB family nuclease
MALYVALIDGETRAFGVVVPDLPGCTSAGGAVEDALRNAAKAVRLWCEDARADGEAIPEPRVIEDLRRAPRRRSPAAPCSVSCPRAGWRSDAATPSAGMSTMKAGNWAPHSRCDRQAINHAASDCWTAAPIAADEAAALSPFPLRFTPARERGTHSRLAGGHP